MNNFRFILLSFLIFICGTIWAQRKMEDLNHGLIAVKTNSGIFISWRVLGNEWYNVAYNLYCNGAKINNTPISESSNYFDANGTIESIYEVRPLIKGVEKNSNETTAVWASQYIDIPVESRAGNYELNDASVGDLDGDGEYEIIVKRLPEDQTVTSIYFPLIEAYKLDGTMLWSINMGPNRLNTKQLNFSVFDYDGDGKAEVLIKSSEGTIDGMGVEIGDTDGDGITNYRSTAVVDDIIDGPEFLSLYNGETGQEIYRTNYFTRDPLSQWGPASVGISGQAHRADNCMMTPAYLDGKHPSFIMCRGIYTRIKIKAFDLVNGELIQRWSFDNIDYPAEYYGQGNHHLSVADVDDDGKDEIIYGGMIIDDDGTGLYSTGLGHGDALHISDMDPDRKGLEIWKANEANPQWGGAYWDAATGEILIQYFSNRDMGRACAGDISADYPGYELWGGTECPLYSCKGEMIGTNNIPCNFMIYWDGDLLREFLNYDVFNSNVGYGKPTISKYSSATNDDYPIFSASGTATINWTKGNPCLQADILGDWREELIVRTNDNTKIRIYTTTEITHHRLYTLMHDSQYRVAISWQNNAYNQPPHPGYFLGCDMDSIPPAPMTYHQKVWKEGADWNFSGNNWIKNGLEMTYSNRDSVLFDISGLTTNIKLNETVSPQYIMVNAPLDYTFSGTGKLSGAMDLNKCGKGSLVLNNNNDYSGITRVWDGELVVNGSLAQSRVIIKRFAKCSITGELGNGIIVQKQGQLAIGEIDSIGKHTIINNGLTLKEEAELAFDLTDEPTSGSKTNDAINLSGDLTIEGTCHFVFHPIDDVLNPGTYELIKFDGRFIGSIADVIIDGIPEVTCRMVLIDKIISLAVEEVREATNITWTGAESNIWNFAGAYNWLNDTTKDRFLGNDRVTFDETGASQNVINITEEVPVGSITVNAKSNYSFNGSGKISGNGGLTKSESGKLAINTTNSFTGSTIINGGSIEVGYLANAGYDSPLGAASADASKLIINGGMLRVNGTNSSTNKSLTLGSDGGTLNIDSNIELSISGTLTGTGALVKDGEGQLKLMSPNNYSGGTVINSGTLNLSTEESTISGLGSGDITIRNGSLQMLDNNKSNTTVNWNIIIPEGSNAYLGLDGRCTLNSNLTGSGNLTIYTPYIRSDLYGDWSTFTGNINVTTHKDGGWLILGNTKGYANTSIHLNDSVFCLYPKSEDVTITIGELSGTAGSTLGAGGLASNTITWSIGAKNTDAIFHGKINNSQYKNSGAKASIIKTGTGMWTLTNANTYSGNTIIEQGTLVLQNTSGSATGTGDITCKSGAILSGSGAISGSVILENGATFLPGYTDINSFDIGKNLTLKEGALLEVDFNAYNRASDIINVSGNIFLDGKLNITNTSLSSYKIYSEFQLFNAANISGSFEQIKPVIPGEGLEWDTSRLNSEGIIKVSKATSSSYNERPQLNVFPNPFSDQLTITNPFNSYTESIQLFNIKGEEVDAPFYQLTKSNWQIDTKNLKAGIYFVMLSVNDDKIYYNTLVKMN